MVVTNDELLPAYVGSNGFHRCPRHAAKCGLAERLGNAYVSDQIVFLPETHAKILGQKQKGDPAIVD